MDRTEDFELKWAFFGSCMEMKQSFDNNLGISEMARKVYKTRKTLNKHIGRKP